MGSFSFHVHLACFLCFISDFRLRFLQGNPNLDAAVKLSLVFLLYLDR